MRNTQFESFIDIVLAMIIAIEASGRGGVKQNLVLCEKRRASKISVSSTYSTLFDILFERRVVD